MKKLQEFLKKHKFLNGPADGNYGTETQAAIKSFQAHEKLLVNSLPDAETVIQALIIPGIKK
ncbi:peptidoglycan-binding protein [Acidiphilium sp. C61]|nr:peptidoglycan-binding domain-containing protein [Acidiphilium sp. C61]